MESFSLKALLAGDLLVNKNERFGEEIKREKGVKLESFLSFSPAFFSKSSISTLHSLILFSSLFLTMCVISSKPFIETAPCYTCNLMRLLLSVMWTLMKLGPEISKINVMTDWFDLICKYLGMQIKADVAEGLFYTLIRLRCRQ